MTDRIATPADLDRMAGLARETGELDRALGLLGVARMAYPGRAELWDRRETQVQAEIARRDNELEAG